MRTKQNTNIKRFLTAFGMTSSCVIEGGNDGGAPERTAIIAPQ